MVLSEINIINFSYITIVMILSGGILGICFLKPPKKPEETVKTEEKEEENNGTP